MTSKSPSVLVVFGSTSDEAVYSEVFKGLKDAGVKPTLRVCSAHRTPQMLEKILKETDAELIISGAGLSAALPGAIASHTTLPVIGVPCAGNYSGLDALLSTVQMPSGIPVISTGVGNAKEAVSSAVKALKEHNGVIMSGNTSSPAVKKAVDKAAEVLGEFKVPYSSVEEAECKNGSNIYLSFVEIEKANSIVHCGESLVIHCPVCSDSKPEHALKLAKLMQSGIWVGLNRGENAALAAIQIRNRNGKHTSHLRSFRKAMAEAVVEADERERKKWK